ncbi:MAG: hypothetical protein ACREDY_02735, partial [Bradyrhizobium sp.]
MSDLTTSSVASYQPASFFSPNGYGVSANTDGSLHVTASGPPATPTERLQKIALARAAEYGNEQHLKTFTATAPEVSIKCGKSKLPTKDGSINVRPLDYRLVSVDVTYGSDVTDPRAKNTRETANTLKAELAAEIVPPDVGELSVGWNSYLGRWIMLYLSEPRRA